MITPKISSSNEVVALDAPYDDKGTGKPTGPFTVSVHDNTVVPGLQTLAGLALVDEITGNGTKVTVKAVVVLHGPSVAVTV